MSENNFTFKWRTLADYVKSGDYEKDCIESDKHYRNLINICDSVFVYQNEQEVQHLLENEKNRQTKVVFVKFSYEDYKKVDDAIYELLRQCVVNLSKTTGLFCFIEQFDKIPKKKILSSPRFQNFIDGALDDTFPVRIFCYLRQENGEFLIKGEAKGHHARNLIKIEKENLIMLV